jgi:hypothetical protein
MSKSVFILSALLTFVSCGKHNESGKSNVPLSTQSPYLVNESAIKDDFLNRGRELLREYDDEIRHLFGQRTVALIRNRLRVENVQTTEQLLMDERNHYTWSNQRDEYVVLYVGGQEPRLSWNRFRQGEDVAGYDRYVMHELLQLGGIPDQNFKTTDRILFRR